MFKIITLTLCVALAHTSIIKQSILIPEDVEILTQEQKGMNHLLDFIELIDLEKTVGVAIQYLGDPEVLKFVNFLLSQEFKDVVAEFESLDEFKQAASFLSHKGYDVQSVIDAINSILDLPSFEIPPTAIRTQRGITSFIEAVLSTLPVEEMKQLYKEKVDNYPEIKELHDILTSEEFKTIIERMTENPKFLEIKAIFEGYGFDFEYLTKLVKEILGF